MPIDEANLLQTLDAMLFSPFLSDPATGVTLEGLENTAIVLERPGRPIHAADYQNPWSPNHHQGSPIVTKRFSNLVDQAIALTAYYQPNGHQISAMYQQVLGAQVTSPTPSVAEKQQSKAADQLLFTVATVRDQKTGQLITTKVPSAVYRNYQRAKVNYTHAVAAYNAQYMQYTRTSEGRETWPLLSASLHGPVDQASDDLVAAQATKVEDALDVIERMPDAIAQAFQDAQQLFTSSRQPDPTVPKEFFVPSYASPSDWSSESETWIEIAFSAQTIADAGTDTAVEFQLTEVAADRPSQLWSIAQQTFSLDPKTDRLSLRLEYELVTIERPWLHFSLFSLPNWHVSDIAPGQLSDGTRNQSADQMFPLLPQSFVAVRDLQISADWGQVDLERIHTALAGDQPAAFAGFWLNQPGVYQAQFKDDTLTFPGIHLVGWINRLVPFSPPKL